MDDITPAGSRKARTQVELPVTFDGDDIKTRIELYNRKTEAPMALLDGSEEAEAALKALQLLLPRSVKIAPPLNRETGRVVAFDHYKTAVIDGKRYQAREIISAALEGWMRNKPQFFRKVTPEAPKNTAQMMAEVAQAG